MRWWVGGGILAASLIVAAVVLGLPDGGPPVPQWRKDLYAARRLAHKDRPAGIIALEALVKEHRTDGNRAAEFEALNELAVHYRLEGRTEAALTAYRALVAFPTFEGMPGDLKGGRWGIKGWIADLACRKAPFDEGIAMYRQMIDASRGGSVHPQYPASSLYINLAHCLKAAGQTEEGLDALRENVVLRLKTVERISRLDIFQARAELARALAEAGRRPEARAEFLALLSIFAARGEIDRRDPAEIAFRRRIEAAKTREEKDRLLDDRRKEHRQRRQEMERRLISLVDTLARGRVFAEPAAAK